MRKGRPKVKAYQNIPGKTTNEMMNHLYGSNRPLKASLSPHYERAGALASQNKDDNSIMMRTALVNAKIELNQLM